MKPYILFVITLLLTTHLFAQHSLKFEYLTIEKGLNHSWAKCLELDQKGYLWIGGIDGISRYNGNDVKTYKLVEGDSTSLSSDFISDITEDNKGNLWIATYFGGLNLYDRKNDAFQWYKNSPKVKGSISSDRVNAVFQDTQGRLWIGTAKGLDLYDYKTNSFHSFYLNKNGQKIGVKEDVRCIYEDEDQSLWVGTTNGLYKLQVENKFIKKYLNVPSNSSSISSNNIRAIYEDELHQLWIGTLGGGINRFSSEGESFVSFSTQNGLSHNSVLCIDGDKNGNIYVGTEGGGLNVIKTKSQEISHIQSNDFVDNSLNSNSIHSLLYDHKADILFIGTYNGGVNYFSKWDKDFHHVKKTALSNKHILSFEEAKNGDIYVGTDGGGINVYNHQKVTEVIDSKKGLTSNVVLDLFLDQKNQLWIGTFNGGLNIYDLKTGKIQVFKHDAKNEKSISANDVSAIFHRSNGEIWIGTMHGGLNKFDPIHKSFKKYRHSEGNPKSISNDFITKIFEDEKGTLMIQSGSTIDIFNDKTNDFTRINSSYKVAFNSTICSHLDSNHNLWLGTRGGLIFLDRSSDSFHKYTVENGLPSNGITSIQEDEIGNLWVSTNKGLIKFINAIHTPETPDFHTFTVEDGLQGLDFKAQAGFKASTGKMYFGGNNGFNFFTPEEIWLNPVKPSTVISKLKLFNKDVSIENEILDQPIDMTESISLPYNQNFLSFEFSALNFLLPSKNKYAYKLEGFDKDWNNADQSRAAHYTNLNPGNYIFKVKATNNDGIWSDSPTTLAIEIIPPFWQRTWFQALSFIAFISFIWLIVRLREKQLKEQKRILSEKVDAATFKIKEINALLEDNNHDLKEKNNELEIQAENINNLLQEVQDNNEAKIRFFTNISHELRTPLTLILGPLKQLMQMKSQDPQTDYEIMYRNANRLLKNVNQLLDFRKLESGNMQLKATENDIVEFTSNIYKSFTYLAKKKNIDYHFNTFHKKYNLWFDVQKMDNIITNLLSNAFKYTPDGKEVSITIHEIKEEILTIEIKDSGMGISQENQNHIFDLYYQANNKINQQTKGSGIGLALIKQLVDLHHAEIELKSTEGQGSSFFIKLNIGDEFLALHEKKDTPTFIPEKEEENFDINTETTTIASTNEQENLQTLLVVEDNEDIRNFIHLNLKNDFNILLAENGKIGLEKALEYSPDYILSDIMMPELNGPELCKLIKNEPQTSHIPVILLTAYSGEETKWNGYNAGADDYIIKPFDVNILRKKLVNMSQTRLKMMEKFQANPSLSLHKVDTNVSKDDFLEQAIQVVKENIDNFNFGVDDFTNHFGMSRRHLLRKVKATTNLSINEFIKNIRLKFAADLMKDPELNISEIAYQSGFNDPKYFSKCFKVEFGMTPSEFKEKQSV